MHRALTVGTGDLIASLISVVCWSLLGYLSCCWPAHSYDERFAEHEEPAEPYYGRDGVTVLKSDADFAREKAELEKHRETLDAAVQAYVDVSDTRLTDCEVVMYCEVVTFACADVRVSMCCAHVRANMCG
jgi:hypothetical protein